MMCSYATWKAVAYASRQLKVHDKNYPTHDLEITAAVKYEGINCIVSMLMCITNHKSLHYVFT